MASTARIDELKKKFDENPRRYFAPLANEFRKAGDIEQAIVICEEFLPQQPGHMSGHIVYGQALYEAGRMPEARTVFETALALDPENLIALRHLGDIARSQADYAAARGWYDRVLEADPRNEEIQSLIASMNAAAPSSPPATAAPEPEPPAQPTAVFHLDVDDRSPFDAPLLSPPLPPPLPQASSFSAPTVAMPAVRLAQEPVSSPAMPDIEPAPETASLMPDLSARAEGLEPAEFTLPAEPIATTSELDTTLGSGVPSFEPPAGHIASVAGLQGSGGMSHEPIMPTPAVSAPAIPEHPAETIHSGLPDFDLALVNDGVAAPAAEQIEQPAVEAEAAAEIPAELPPEVLAAEAQLMDEREASVPAGSERVAAADAEPPASHEPFVTETMAELYVAQGFREEALEVYSQLSAAEPSNQRLRTRVEELSQEPAPADTGPNVREFFARFASRRPVVRAAAPAPPSNEDFAYHEEGVAEEAVAEAPAPVEAHAPEPATMPAEAAADAPEYVAPAIERAAEVRTPSGSIDALFGNRRPATSEDSAAAALAQAFGGSTSSVQEISGRPARAASGELSLDSVFRDGPSRPPRPSQAFSFDQFFSEGASSGNAPRTSGSQQTQRASDDVAADSERPAERSADDIEQFNAWLQGLKQR